VVVFRRGVLSEMPYVVQSRPQRPSKILVDEMRNLIRKIRFCKTALNSIPFLRISTLSRYVSVSTDTGSSKFATGV